MKFPVRLMQAYEGVGLVPCKQASVHRKRQRKLWLEPLNDLEKCLQQQWRSPHPKARRLSGAICQANCELHRSKGEILFIAIHH